jgi:hypothetical protein
LVKDRWSEDIVCSLETDHVKSVICCATGKNEVKEEKEEKPIESSQETGEWCEAVTPEGYTYYWNTVTRGTNLFCNT